MSLSTQQTNPTSSNPEECDSCVGSGDHCLQNTLVFPTDVELDEMLREKKNDVFPILPWNNLTTNKWYRIESSTTKTTRFGLKTLVNVVDREGWECFVWTPESVKARIAHLTLPIYIRPIGLRACQNNPHKYYYDVDLI